MDDTTTRFLAQRLARFAPEIITAARANALDPWLLGALVLTESAGNPFAIRVERGFWTRYAAAIIRRARATPQRTDDAWLIYPDLVAASYGLCQIMYPTACDLGLSFNYPTELLDVALNLDLGARILSRNIARNNGSIRLGLLAYNGGGNADYPATVLAWRVALLHSDAIDLGQKPQLQPA